MPGKGRTLASQTIGRNDLEPATNSDSILNLT